MTKQQVIGRLKSTNCKYAEISVDVYGRNELTPCYPDEKVIVSVLETQVREDFPNAYAVFDSIRDFRESAVVGRAECRKAYCNYFFEIKHISFVF